MKRVQENGTWSLFCPNEARGLADCWGDEFENLYVKYENEVQSLSEPEWDALHSGFLHYGTGMFLSEVSDPLYLVHRVRPRGWLKLKSYGLQYWRLKLRLEIPTCCSRYAASFLNCLNIMLTWLFEVATARWCRNCKLCYLEFESTCATLLIGCVDPRMHATGKAINRTLVLSSLLICARRLWNFLARRKQQYATLPPSLSHALSGRRWGLSCWSNVSCCLLLTHTQVFLIFCSM